MRRGRRIDEEGRERECEWLSWRKGERDRGAGKREGERGRTGGGKWDRKEI